MSPREYWAPSGAWVKAIIHHSILAVENCAYSSLRQEFHLKAFLWALVLVVWNLVFLVLSGVLVFLVQVLVCPAVAPVFQAWVFPMWDFLAPVFLVLVAQVPALVFPPLVCLAQGLALLWGT